MKIQINNEMRTILLLAGSPWWAKELHSEFGQTAAGAHSSISMLPCSFDEVQILVGESGVEIVEIDEIQFQGAGIGGVCSSKIYSVDVLGTGYQYVVMKRSGFIVDHQSAWEKWCTDNSSTTLDGENLQYQKLLMRG